MQVQEQYKRLIHAARSGHTRLLAYHIDRIHSMWKEDEDESARQIIESKTPDMAVTYFLEKKVEFPKDLENLVFDIHSFAFEMKNGGDVLDFILKNAAMRKSYLTQISTLNPSDLMVALDVGVKYGQLSEDDLIRAYNPSKYNGWVGGFENIAIGYGMKNAETYFRKIRKG